MATRRRYSGTGTEGASGGGENLVLVEEDIVGVEEAATFPWSTGNAERNRLL